MISTPPIQNQDNKPTQDQLKALRTYLYQLVQEIQMELNRIENKIDERKQ